MITVDLSDTPAASNIVESDLLTLRPFLARARRAVGLSGQVSVLLTSDKEIRRLNRVYRGKNKATDVLSFPAVELPKKNSARTQPSIAGDLAISIDTAARQASQFGHPLRFELKILLLHGLLHLAGFDHEADQGEMAVLEDRLRRRFRLPSTLIVRAAAATHAARGGGR